MAAPGIEGLEAGEGEVEGQPRGADDLAQELVEVADDVVQELVEVADAQGQEEGRADVNANEPEPDDVAANSTSLVALLANECVAEDVLKFLYLEDMKALSISCRTILHAVRGTMAFKEKARFNVNNEVLSSGVLRRTTCQWKHIVLSNLEGNITPMTAEMITEKLRYVESLLIIGTYAPDLIRSIMRRAQMLRELEIDVGMLRSGEVFTCREVQDNMAKLSCVKITDKYYNPHHHLGEPEDFGRAREQRILLQLSEIPLEWKKFSYVMKHNRRFVSRIIFTIAGTLEELEINEMVKFTSCPKLKSVSMLFREENSLWNFLVTQEPLEELVIDQCKNPFVEMAEAGVHGVFVKMKKLHVLQWVMGTDPVPFDCTVLQEIPKLEDFAFQVIPPPVGGRLGLGCVVVTKLPQGIKKLRMMNFRNIFWPSYVANGNIGTLLSRFTSLTELNLTETYVINDASLQTIITNFPKLTKLAITGGCFLTNFGISGERDGRQEGKALKDLKSLVVLWICVDKCATVSASCLQRAIKFPHLRSFYCRLGTLKRASFGGLSAFSIYVLKRNPCLEELLLAGSNFDSLQTESDELWKMIRRSYPRVHRLEAGERIYEKFPGRWEIMREFAMQETAEQ